jgi:hypothetical protein
MKTTSRNALWGMILVVTLLSITLVSARTEYFQFKQDRGNGTIRNFMYVLYDKSSDDFVKGNDAYELYLWYNVYPKQWNSANPNYSIYNCSMEIEQLIQPSTSPTMIFNKTYLPTDEDNFNNQYFISMHDGEVFQVTQECNFVNSSYNQLKLPMEMQIVTPTTECKACQLYEWSLREKDILSAVTLDTNRVTISNYIGRLVFLNLEIILALFWIFLILIIFVAIGLIFIGAYYLYLYLKGVVNKI